MNLLAIIPARGGSKGIPGKNLALLDGDPLIKFSIDAAQAAHSVGEILVSTDSDEIATYCETLGLSLDYRRPAHLASDDALMADTIIDVLDWLARRDREPSSGLVLLQPTSPLRTAGDIDQAAKMFGQDRFESVVSVHKMIEHPYECVADDNGKLERLAKPPRSINGRQDYNERFYFLNGAIYITTPAFLREHRRFYNLDSVGLYEMPPDRGVDIDTPRDMETAAARLMHDKSFELGNLISA